MILWVSLLYYVNGLAFAGVPLGLNECFLAAIQRSEDVAQSRELTFQAEETLTQARSAFLPTVTGTGTFLVQANRATSTGVSLYPPNQNTVKLTAQQPIFQGLKEYAALRQQRDLHEASQDNQQQARLVLFQNVVMNYYRVLSAQQDLKNLDTEIQYNQKRLTELNYFKSLGRSRDSEVLTLQSNIASLQAQVEASRGQWENAKLGFAFVTGLSSETPIYDSEKIPQGSSSVDSLQSYLSRVDQRPDIQSLMKTVMATEESVSIARGGHLPTVELLGNYYFTRPGLLSEVNWDFQVILTLPLFQGGIVQSQVRQAASVNQQSQFALSKARRQAQQQIESYYKLYLSDVLQLDKQKIAVELAMKSYGVELRDYRMGLVTNLDVLRALTASQESQRLLDRAYFQIKMDYLLLQASAARVPGLLSFNN